MVLKAKIKDIQKKKKEYQESLNQYLESASQKNIPGNEGILASVTRATEQAREIDEQHTDFLIRDAITEHFTTYPSHREIAFGHCLTLEERAREFLQEEFGIKDKEGKILLDKHDHPRYERWSWRIKEYNQRLLENQLSKEIESIVGHLPSISIDYGLSLARGGVGGFCLGAIGDLFIHTLVSLPFVFVLAGGLAVGMGVGPLASFISPFKTTLNGYLKAAKEADRFLQEDVKGYLTRQPYPYRGLPTEWNLRPYPILLLP